MSLGGGVVATVLDMQDYYNLLGIPSDAPAAQVRRAFRARAKAVHPDAHPHLAPAEQDALRRQFIALAQAYETLSDSRRRAAYDLRRPALRPGAGPGQRPTGRPSERPGARSRATSSGAPGARSSRAERSERTTGPAGAASGESLEGLLRDVEDLLGRFGLDLRPPFEALLEALLDWAREVYRQVAGAWRAGAAGGSASRGDGGARPAAADSAERERARRAHPSPGADAAGPPGDAAARRAQAELDALRERLRRRAAAPARAPPDVEAELRALKQRLGKRP
jgi:curved DNA-binding protein CbpA